MMLIEHNDEKFYDDAEVRALYWNTTCACGCYKLMVTFIPAPFSGCYLKPTCPECGASEVIFDDYS